MTRHVENLARLHSKLLARYGSDDPMVEGLKRELETAVCANSAAAMLPGASRAAPLQGRAGWRPHRRFEAAAAMSAH